MFLRTSGIPVLPVLSSSLHAQFAFERYFGASSQDNGLHLASHDDGTFVGTGLTLSFGEGAQGFVAGMDQEGEVGWFTSFGGASVDFGHNLIATSDGRFVLHFNHPRPGRMTVMDALGSVVHP